MKMEGIMFQNLTGRNRMSLLLGPLILTIVLNGTAMAKLLIGCRCRHRRRIMKYSFLLSCLLLYSCSRSYEPFPSMDYIEFEGTLNEFCEFYEHNYLNKKV